MSSAAPIPDCFADQPPIAAEVARGVTRLFCRQDWFAMCEVPLPNGRRADLVAIDPKGHLTIVEIKVSRADLLGDGKWRDYLDYCDHFFWAVPQSLAHFTAAEHFLPDAAGLIVADKPDSQDICFVPDGDYASLVKKLRPETAAPGEIVHVSGEVLGRHEGVVHFTIGQRRGIDIGGQAQPLYVVRIEPEARRLVVGPRRALAVAAASVDGLNWLAEDQRAVHAKVRSMAPAVPVHWDGERLEFERPEYGVAPGQSAVFYDGERLLGGGTIVTTESAAIDEAEAA